LFRLPSDPLGTPNPAEFFWNTKFPGLSCLEKTIGVLFASTSEPAPTVGACGEAARNGEWTEVTPGGVACPPTLATLFNPFHVPPGCQPHPYPGKNDHVPE
jgi:hypothetical protein